MRYSIEPSDRIYIKGYGFLSFVKNMGKSLSNKYGQKIIDSAKKSTADAIKTASKSAIQKTTEATGDLIGNKIADKITSVSKKPSNNNNNNKQNRRPLDLAALQLAEKLHKPIIRKFEKRKVYSGFKDNIWVLI